MLDTWSHSQAEAFLSCPRRYFYRYGCDKKALDRVGVEANWSKSLVHPSLAALWAGGGGWGEEQWERGEEDFLSELEEGDKTHALYNLSSAQKLEKQYEREVDREGFSLLAVEQFYRFPIGGGEMIVVPDLVLRDREGLLCTLDFKTSKYEKPELSLSYNSQMVGQAVAVAASYFLVDEITLSSTQKSGVRFSLQRHQVFVPDDIKAQWKEEQAALISWRDSCQVSGVWPKRSSSCYQYRQPCPFIRVCEAGVGMRTPPGRVISFSCLRKDARIAIASFHIASPVSADFFQSEEDMVPSLSMRKTGSALVYSRMETVEGSTPGGIEVPPWSN